MQKGHRILKESLCNVKTLGFSNTYLATLCLYYMPGYCDIL